jgi:hypothetical protein
LWPGRVDVALPSSGACDGAGDQILVSVYQLVVLKAQQDKEVNILLEEVDAPLILNRAREMLVARKENTLSHEEFDYGEEGWMAVHVKANFVQYRGLLGDKLILLAVVAHVVSTTRASLEGSEPVLVSHVILMLLSLGRFVARELAEELAGGRHVGVFLVVLGSDEEAAESLKHYGALVHLLPVVLEVVGQELVQKNDGMIS